MKADGVGRAESRGEAASAGKGEPERVASAGGEIKYLDETSLDLIDF